MIMQIRISPFRLQLSRAHAPPRSSHHAVASRTNTSHAYGYGQGRLQRSTTQIRSSNESPKASEETSNEDSSKLTYAKIKSFGVAGVLSYVLTEVAFWALAIPAAIFSYHETTGAWLSIETDRVQLIGIAAGFITAVRFFVPLRMGAAFALIPLVQKALDGSKTKD